MPERTLANIVRHIATQALAHEEQVLTVSLPAIVQNLDPDGAPMPGTEEMDAAVAALKKKMTKSYITITINRMKDVQAVNKSAVARFFTCDDRGVAMLEVGFKEGNTTRERGAIQTDRTQYKRGYHDGLDKAISFVPDFVDYSDEETLIARRLLVEMRAHLATLKEGAE